MFLCPSRAENHGFMEQEVKSMCKVGKEFTFMSTLSVSGKADGCEARQVFLLVLSNMEMG